MMLKSIDANLPLLGAKFVSLFIVFHPLLMLVPFNIILLRFNLITKFKPLYWMLIKDHTRTKGITGLDYN